MAAFAPLFIATFYGSEFPGELFNHIIWSVVTVGLSTVLGVAGLWLIGFIKCWIFGSDAESCNFFPFESRSATGFTFVRNISQHVEGVLKPIGLGTTDLQFFVYLVFLAFVHHQVARRLENDEYWLTSAPSMLVLFLWLVLMTLAGLANWLDRWRIPPLVVFVLLISLFMSIRGSTRLLNSFPDTSDNGFVGKMSDIREKEDELLDGGGDIRERRLLIADETLSFEQDAWAAIQNRMRRLESHDSLSSKGKTLVVVTCPGGGIHAAAWASCVLDQLSEKYVEFKDSLCVVSGVSGGSVGTLFFIGSRYENELIGELEVGASQPSVEETHKLLKEKSPALELSARSSLEAIAFGATVDDLYSLVGIPGAGRGQRLEDSWNSRLHDEIQTMTIGQWGDRSKAGVIPIVVFNSTDAVSGRRVLFDTIPTPRRTSSVGLTARPLNYRELLNTQGQARDLLPATAARTSATFPYISPFTKPNGANDIGNHVAMCDGGYVDNEGIVTAVNWIEFFLKQWEDETPDKKTFDRILLLRIEPSSVEDKNQPATSGGIAGVLRWLTGPGEAIANVRAASQLERGNLESDLTEFHLKRSPEPIGEPAEAMAFQLEKKFNSQEMPTQSVVEIPSFDKRKLSGSEIRKNWDEMLYEFQRDIKGVGEDQEVESPTFSQAIVDTDDNQSTKPLVVVQSITFVDANQSIPLNWKLSNEQKFGYLLAWSLCSSEGSSIRETLDRFFTRTDDSVK
ncbi:hypothetical protein [Bremerella sp.]|uniref:hypothetical protein n=1 Tax=Bremerella sp. TaxID=2795602 RepID=UPI00391BC2E7